MFSPPLIVSSTCASSRPALEFHRASPYD